MKKILFLALAVLMILPLVVACSSAPEGNPIAVADFSVISYSTAYDEAGIKDEAMAVEIYKGEVTAYVAEGATMTLKDVIEGYIYDKGVDASTNSAGTIYESLAGYAADGTFFWNFYVNGREASLSAQVQPTDSIKVVFEK